MNNKLKIRDLCGRLPYGVCCLLVLEDSVEVVRVSAVETDTGAVVLHGDIYPAYYDDWLAYLRPMSSLTDEEREELILRQDTMLYSSNTPLGEAMMGLLDYVYKHHIDYFGLIEQGLALEAPKDMYV